MNLTILRVFAVIGGFVVGAVFAYLVILLWEAVVEARRQAVIKRQIKHRFDGTPTAKCWCRDCKWHGVESNKCGLPGIGRYTPDNGFCYEADPRT